MLARSFKTAEELGISEVEREALATVLGMMERGEIDDYAHRLLSDVTSFFYMPVWMMEESCGTVACIAGWAHEISGKKAFPWVSHMIPPVGVSDELIKLFSANGSPGENTVAQAIEALSRYLTTGQGSWA